MQLAPSVTARQKPSDLVYLHLFFFMHLILTYGRYVKDENLFDEASGLPLVCKIRGQFAMNDPECR